MRAHEFILEGFADDVIPIIQSLNLTNVKRISGNRVKVVVPGKDRKSTANAISSKIPGTTVTQNGKIVCAGNPVVNIYGQETCTKGAIFVKPEEEQAGRRNVENEQRIALDRLIKQHLQHRLRRCCPLFPCRFLLSRALAQGHH